MTRAWTEEIILLNPSIREILDNMTDHELAGTKPGERLVIRYLRRIAPVIGDQGKLHRDTPSIQAQRAHP
jgi:hypothetical protein